PQRREAGARVVSCRESRHRNDEGKEVARRPAERSRSGEDAGDSVPGHNPLEARRRAALFDPFFSLPVCAGGKTASPKGGFLPNSLTLPQENDHETHTLLLGGLGAG